MCGQKHGWNGGREKSMEALFSMTHFKILGSILLSLIGKDTDAGKD